MRYIASIVCFLCLLFTPSAAQTYRYLKVEDGLSDRRVFNIQKDSVGYMWFLTNEGIDRYDSKSIKHYRLSEQQETPDLPIRIGWLCKEDNGGLWVIGKGGRVFQYDQRHDRFNKVYRLPVKESTISYSYIDNNHHLWLCTKYSIILYDTRNGQIRQTSNTLQGNITCIEQIDDTHFFIATETGIRFTQLTDQYLQVIPTQTLEEIKTQVSSLYYHQNSQRLIIGTFERGLLAYDMKQQAFIPTDAGLNDVNITRIKELNDKELLIATEGMGIHKMDINTCMADPYITASYLKQNEMGSNNISDIYVDEEKRIWVANYPEGITIVDNRYKNYNWIRHSIGNRQSIINNQVHSVIEDCDGDLWFGTSNGISLYMRKSGVWHTFLSSFDKQLKDKNCIFITLCEVSPGVIWAGGYTSGIYKINKKTLSVEYFSPYLLTSTGSIRPDKYIREIIKDSDGDIWSGGYYNLKCIDPSNNTVRFYPGISSVTAIAEKDREHIWVGTTTGLYLLHKSTGQFQFITLQEPTTYINTLYQSEELLYIGTSGAGLMVYDAETGEIQQYCKDNSALVTNNIYTILPETEGILIMSTENGISRYYLKNQKLQNWTREEGLSSACFSATSGARLQNNAIIFGSTDGAVEFPEGTVFPKYEYHPMIISDLNISYQIAYPGEKDSPLKKDINQTDLLKLTYKQNTFSLRVTSINYDSPVNTIFYWQLGNAEKGWSPLNKDGVLSFTNLTSGKYTLRIRAVSKEEPYFYFEERSIHIAITPPIWRSTWALLGYLLITILIYFGGFRLISLKKQKKISEEKTRFFINTAHDIRTPLTLIKAPLEELAGNDQLNQSDRNSMNIALRNVNSLLQLTTNLINFERVDVYASKLYIAEYELNAYMQEVCNHFQAYAASKRIRFTYDSDFTYQNVWFDKEKMDSILKNLLTNAMKYTPDGGEVSIFANDNKESWRIKVSDNGIGIPTREQKKLFKLHFRGSNAINSKITGSGIGLMLVRKLVHLHRGKIEIDSAENRGTVVRITFPKGKSHFHPSDLMPPAKPIAPKPPQPQTPLQPKLRAEAGDAPKQRILIAEDNDELRSYLIQCLSDTYDVQACSNGKEALHIVKEFYPELIISDIMMPEMRGDELCTAIKNNIETSHIPVLLLTALSEERHILDGLKMGADEYIGKPFSLNILKASIANLLNNRALLRRRYANPDMEEATPPQNIKCSNPLDWQFISSVKQHVNEHISESGFNVDSLCALMGMSRTSFYNKLKALTGQAPADYVRLIRLKRASELLEKNEYSITEVADLTGFCDGKYFRETFKKYYGVSPSQYAKGERGENNEKKEA